MIISIVFLWWELLDITTSIHAVMNDRTSQGEVSWEFSIVTFPWLT
jgi:hypothetical protein